MVTLSMLESTDDEQVFDEVLKHEQYISASINEVAAMATKESDFATINWIQWFIAEQVEEEASVGEVIDKLKLVGKHNMYMFDRDILSMRGSGGEEAQKNRYV